MRAREMARMDARLRRESHQRTLAHPEFAWRLISREGDSEVQTQVFCDRGFFSRNKEARHITLVGSPQDKSPSWKITPCTLGKGRESHEFKADWDRHMKFPAELLCELKALGWKPRRERPHMIPQVPELRGFPEETLMLYGRKFLSDSFLPKVEAMLTLERNMFAANRMLAPTPTGYQCGHYPAQMKVAELARKLAKAKLDERKRWSR